MSYRPLTAAQYVDYTGSILPRDFAVNERWRITINVLNSIAAVLAIPVTSLIIAEASVVWLQRQDNEQPFVSLAQFFDIADRGWTDGRVISNEIVAALRHGSALFIVKAAAFLVLCGLIQPLQQLLVDAQDLQVITCRDIPYIALVDHGGSFGDGHGPDAFWGNDVSSTYAVNGYDAQLGLMSELPLWNIKEQVKMQVAASSGNEKRPTIWSTMHGGSAPNVSSGAIGNLYNAFRLNETDLQQFWISAVANGTTTGVLPQHALRLNYTVSCKQVDVAKARQACPGLRPFTAGFSTSTWEVFGTDGEDDWDLQVCVPGSYSDSPWSRSRDAETISEEIYFSLKVGPDAQGSWIGDTFGMRCEANTTRGYFELGNAYNDFMPQPFLAKYPRGEDSEKFSDFTWNFTLPPAEYKGVEYPQETRMGPAIRMGPLDDAEYMTSSFQTDSPRSYARPDGSGSTYMRTPGPLATLAVALFSNESFFAMAERATRLNTSEALVLLCQSYRVPFWTARNTLGSTTGYENPSTVLIDACADAVGSTDANTSENGYGVILPIVNWFTAFSDAEVTRSLLGQGLFYACDALLSQSAQIWDNVHPREIYTSAGHTTTKPQMSKSSLIVLSVLLAIEVIGLLCIAFYAWRTHTWTGTFKSLTVAQLANEMEKNTLPPAGCRDTSRLAMLNETSGRIGVLRMGNAAVRLAFGGQEPVNLSNLPQKRGWRAAWQEWWERRYEVKY